MSGIAERTHRIRTELPELVQTYALVHDAMRRDVARLPRAIERGADDLDRWFTRFEAEVVHHHQREDEIVFPTLLQRVPPFAAARADLEADHHVLDEAMARLGSALRAGSADRLDAAHDLRTVLDDHLDREEDATFGLLCQHFTPEEYAELERRMLKGTPLKLVAFELPWAADGLADEELAELLTKIPAPFRALFKLAFRPAYRRVSSPLTR